MDEIYNEQLVKRLQNQQDTLKKVGFICIAVIIAFAVIVFIPSLLFFIVALEMVILYFVFRRMNIEYEYVITNNELDINKIFNKASRKKVFSLNIKDITAMVPAKQKEYAHEVSEFDSKIDCSSGQLLDNTYIVVFRNGNKSVQMTFEPNEKILKTIKAFIPRIVRK